MLYMNESLEALIKLMAERKTDIYIVPTADYHGSEYVGEYFQIREYLTGFSGSAGTLVVVKEEAYLFTDGRYHLQAERELNGSGIILMKSGLPGVPSVADFVVDCAQSGSVIGFDGRCISAKFYDSLVDKSEKAGKRLTFVTDEDLASRVWTSRPELKSRNVYELRIKNAGSTREEKIAALCSELRSRNIEYFVVTALDETAWLLNIRGADVLCNPVLLSFLVVSASSERVTIYLNRSNEYNVSFFTDLEINTRDYDDIYSVLSEQLEGRSVLIDNRTANCRIKESLKKSVLTEDISPIYLKKAVKNAAECSGERIAHIKDGVAMVRFLYWLKKSVGREKITEISAAEKLLALRREQEGFLDESFPAIMAYADNAAIIHYQANQDTNRELKNKGLILMDTGAHYDTGTTDITRTVALGPLSDEEKKAFTVVLAAHLRLINAVFLEGTGGRELDMLARSVLWRHGLEYRHGTGHGVGHILNVHEGPNTISIYRSVNNRELDIIREGMVTSCEPGYYKDGEYGIRHENLTLCKRGVENEYGQFLYFENLTMVPFDIEAVDKKYLSSEDIKYLNDYHRTVYERISPYLEGDELEFLKSCTREILP